MHRLYIPSLDNYNRILHNNYYILLLYSVDWHTDTIPYSRCVHDFTDNFHNFLGKMTKAGLGKWRTSCREWNGRTRQSCDF